MGFLDEVEEVCGHRPKSWTFRDYEGGNDDDAGYLWFDHYPRDYKHGAHGSGDPLPLPFEVLEALDEKYGVVEVESHSDGETGSKLSVLLEDILV